jgi:hypothetical protein
LLQGPEPLLGFLEEFGRAGVGLLVLLEVERAVIERSMEIVHLNDVPAWLSTLVASVDDFIAFVLHSLPQDLSTFPRVAFEEVDDFMLVGRGGFVDRLQDLEIQDLIDQSLLQFPTCCSG